jgi:hypothetical protein
MLWVLKIIYIINKNYLLIMRSHSSPLTHKKTVLHSVSSIKKKSKKNPPKKIKNKSPQQKVAQNPQKQSSSQSGNEPSPQLNQNVPNKLPLKPSTLTPNARKLEYKMYKEAFVILRFQKINLTLQLMTKITKQIQINIRNEFKQNLQKLTKNIPNKKNKELKIFQSILGTIQNNFQKIETINASSLTINQQNKKNTLDSLIQELFQQFKTVPESVTQKEKIIIYYYLQTLINQLYFLYNIDLSEKNNKNIYDFGAFYQLMIGELKNIEEFSSLSESKNVKTGGENNTFNPTISQKTEALPINISKQKFTLFKQGLLLYRLTLILGLLESMKKICTTIQTKFTKQYKKNVASFKKLEGVNSYQIQNFSQAISMFGNHFNKITRLNEKKFFRGMENSEIAPLKENVLHNLMNQLNNNFKTVPLESTEKNKIQFHFLLQNIILVLFYFYFYFFLFLIN